MCATRPSGGVRAAFWCRWCLILHAFPPLNGRRLRLMRRMMVGASSGTATVAGVALVFNAFGTAERLCTLPGPQPALSDSCAPILPIIRKGRSAMKRRLCWRRAPAKRARCGHLPCGTSCCFSRAALAVTRPTHAAPLLPKPTGRHGNCVRGSRLPGPRALSVPPQGPAAGHARVVRAKPVAALTVGPIALCRNVRGLMMRRVGRPRLRPHGGHGA
jgi:hypothetical protein